MLAMRACTAGSVTRATQTAYHRRPWCHCCRMPGSGPVVVGCRQKCCQTDAKFIPRDYSISEKTVASHHQETMPESTAVADMIGHRGSLSTAVIA